MPEYLAPEIMNKYLTSPNFCPKCGQKSGIESSDSTHDDRFHWFDLKCGLCEATWTEVYVLSDVYFTNKDED